VEPVLSVVLTRVGQPSGEEKEAECDGGVVNSAKIDETRETFEMRSICPLCSQRTIHKIDRTRAEEICALEFA
jgi:transposase